MFRLGVRNTKINADQPWHSPKFKVDESALKTGTALLALSTLDQLSGRSA
jgi:metal-dependent amidase/aminoacylase/carboxypeptidase family protein